MTVKPTTPRSQAAPPLPTDLEELLRRLRLPHIRRHAPVRSGDHARCPQPAEVSRRTSGGRTVRRQAA